MSRSVPRLLLSPRIAGWRKIDFLTRKDIHGTGRPKKPSMMNKAKHPIDEDAHTRKYLKKGVCTNSCSSLYNSSLTLSTVSKSHAVVSIGPVVYTRSVQQTSIYHRTEHTACLHSVNLTGLCSSTVFTCPRRSSESENSASAAASRASAAQKPAATSNLGGNQLAMGSQSAEQV